MTRIKVVRRWCSLPNCMNHVAYVVVTDNFIQFRCEKHVNNGRLDTYEVVE